MVKSVIETVRTAAAAGADTAAATTTTGGEECGEHEDRLPAVRSGESRGLL